MPTILQEVEANLETLVAERTEEKMRSLRGRMRDALATQAGMMRAQDTEALLLPFDALRPQVEASVRKALVFEIINILT